MARLSFPNSKTASATNAGCRVHLSEIVTGSKYRRRMERAPTRKLPEAPPAQMSPVINNKFYIDWPVRQPRAWRHTPKWQPVPLQGTRARLNNVLLFRLP